MFGAREYKNKLYYLRTVFALNLLRECYRGYSYLRSQINTISLLSLSLSLSKEDYRSDVAPATACAIQISSTPLWPDLAVKESSLSSASESESAVMGVGSLVESEATVVGEKLLLFSSMVITLRVWEQILDHTREIWD